MGVTCNHSLMVDCFFKICYFATSDRSGIALNFGYVNFCFFHSYKSERVTVLSAFFIDLFSLKSELCI